MLKILAGEYRSRRLLTPEDDSTRPYAGRVRDSVFGMLHEWFDGARVLDLFAGVGTVGLEAVSRGASHVVMVERDRKVYKLLKANIESLGCHDRAEAVRADALGPTALGRAPVPVNLLFADPPYEMMRDDRTRQRMLAQLARACPLMADRSFLVLRTTLNPNQTPHEIEGFIGPEVHQYRPDMWVLLYEPEHDDASRPHSGPDGPSAE